MRHLFSLHYAAFTYGLLIVLLLVIFCWYRYQTHADAQLQRMRQQNCSLEKLLQLQSQSLQEKEWLVREIHHRVKNNLQIVMSLLNTQLAYLESDAALAAIRDSRLRLHAVSLIHQKLYGGDATAQIDMPAYLRDIVLLLQDSFNDMQRIHFELELDAVRLNATQAVSVGQILNEAITNAIKHAFGDQQRGCIYVGMHCLGGRMVKLVIADTGPGLPAGLNTHNGATLGMRLLRTFSEQLAGNLTFENRDGLVLTLVFTYEPEATQPVVQEVAMIY